MSIKCNNKKCGHVNADGNSYCVKCGEVLPGMFPKTVVIEYQYRKLNSKVENQEKELDDIKEERERILANVSTLQKELDELKENGFAPEGYHLEKDKSYWELSLENLNNEKLRKYDDLVRRANQTWSQKLWQAIKKWWDNTGKKWALRLAWMVGVAIGSFLFICLLSLLFPSKGNKVLVKAEQRDGLWGLVNSKGETVLPFEYDSIVTDRFDTIYARVYQKGNVGLVKTPTGEEIVPCKYQSIGERDQSSSFRGKLIAVKKDDGKMMFVDYNGEPKGRQNWDRARWWSDAEYGVVGRKIGGVMKYGFVNEQGELVIDCQYSNTYNFFEGLALVKKGYRIADPWICIDKDGKEQYKLKYTMCDIYHDSLMAVTDCYEWTATSCFGFVDRKGELVIGMYFTPWADNGDFWIPRFHKGKARVCYNGQNGWIDKSGKFTPQK